MGKKLIIDHLLNLIFVILIQHAQLWGKFRFTAPCKEGMIFVSKRPLNISCEYQRTTIKLSFSLKTMDSS